MEHTCTTCGKSYVNRRNLLRHVRVSHEGKWSCLHCSESFDNDKLLMVHQRTCGDASNNTEAESSNRHSCPMCTCSYANRRHLLEHVRKSHGGIYTCPRCKSTYNRADNFSYHERICDFKATGVKRPAQSQVG